MSFGVQEQGEFVEYRVLPRGTPAQNSMNFEVGQGGPGESGAPSAQERPEWATTSPIPGIRVASAKPVAQMEREMELELQNVKLSGQCARLLKELPSLNGTEGREAISDFFTALETRTTEWSSEKIIEVLAIKVKGKARKEMAAVVSRKNFLDNLSNGTFGREIDDPKQLPLKISFTTQEITGLNGDLAVSKRWCMEVHSAAKNVENGGCKGSRVDQRPQSERKGSETVEMPPKSADEGRIKALEKQLAVVSKERDKLKASKRNLLKELYSPKVAKMSEERELGAYSSIRLSKRPKQRQLRGLPTSGSTGLLQQVDEDATSEGAGEDGPTAAEGSGFLEAGDVGLCWPFPYLNMRLKEAVRSLNSGHDETSLV
ncbi:hypothetical protein GPALN_010369 [Globodera pallida]|nr:hypothetical protein GPALN_010369 [Globodera pallida]